MLIPVEWIYVQGGGAVAGLDVRTMRAHAAAGIAEGPIRVALTHRGRYEIDDGHHRAALAIADGATALECEVVRVSPSWARLVEDLRGLYDGREFLYQPIEHPAFAGWRVDRSAERLALVRAAAEAAGVGPGDGPCLDIGSCTGAFCRSFCRDGWTAFGVDRDPDVVRVAEHLDLVFGTDCHYRIGDDPEPLLGAGPGWSVVTCLSVFHRPLAAGDVARVGALYRRIMGRARVAFLDSASPDDASVRSSAISWGRDPFGAWLRSIAPPGVSVEPIGETEGRWIFRCLRTR